MNEKCRLKNVVVFFQTILKKCVAESIKYNNTLNNKLIKHLKLQIFIRSDLARVRKSC